MPKFLTVKEAATLTGKSPSSIRRIFYPILENPKHADRNHIEPNEKEAKTLRLAGETFAWRISEELLHREADSKVSRPSGRGKLLGADGERGSAAVIDMLQRELEIKNKQIDAQTELLRELNQRLREGNILMGSLQQQLALTDGSHRNQKSVDAEASSPTPEKASGDATPTKRKTSWLFKKIF